MEHEVMERCGHLAVGKMQNGLQRWAVLAAPTECSSLS